MSSKIVIWSVVVIILIFPLQHTYSLYRKYVALQREVSLDTSKPLRKQIEKDVFTVDIDRQIFEVFTSVESKNSAKLIKMSPSSRTDENEFVSLYTKEITLEGKFTDILRYVLELDKKLRGIKISSITFLLTEEHEKNKLNAIIYFQSVKLKNYE